MRSVTSPCGHLCSSPRATVFHNFATWYYSTDSPLCCKRLAAYRGSAMDLHEGNETTRHAYGQRSRHDNFITIFRNQFWARSTVRAEIPKHRCNQASLCRYTMALETFGHRDGRLSIRRCPQVRVRIGPRIHLFRRVRREYSLFTRAGDNDMMPGKLRHGDWRCSWCEL